MMSLFYPPGWPAGDCMPSSAGSMHFHMVNAIQFPTEEVATAEAKRCLGRHSVGIYDWEHLNPFT